MTSSANIYDELAESWYNRRHYTRFRRQLEALVARWRGGRLLNIGCGHGPDFLPFTGGTFDLVGLDSSREMLRYGHKYAAKFRFSPALVQADAVQFPFRDASFDHAIAIAVYHHIRGKEARLQAYGELHRVLRPGGEAFITVWNLGRIPLLPRRRDVTVPWNVRGKTVQRYVYVYCTGELRGELAASGFHVLSQRPRFSLFQPFYRNLVFLVARV